MRPRPRLEPGRCTLVRIDSFESYFELELCLTLASGLDYCSISTQQYIAPALLLLATIIARSSHILIYCIASYTVQYAAYAQ